jgi:hypothetical protein
MFILSVPWDFRSLWAALTLTAKLYMVCLFVAMAYSSYCLVRIAVRLRRMARNGNLTRALLNEMRSKTQTVCELHVMLFLFFGLCWSNEAFVLRRSIQYASESLSFDGINPFEPFVAFIFVVFAILIFLHAFRWAVAHRLRSALGRVLP